MRAHERARFDRWLEAAGAESVEILPGPARLVLTRLARMLTDADAAGLAAALEFAREIGGLEGMRDAIGLRDDIDTEGDDR